nr:unnamed protein product [Digitaria exilis]
MATPTSTSIGVLGSLLCKLEGSRGIHYPLKAHLEEIHGYLNQLLWLEEPTLKQKSWMKEVRELSYDIDDYLDMNPNSTEKQVHDEFSTHLQEAIERYKRYNLHVSQLQRKYLPVSHHQLQRKYLPASHQPTQYTEVTDLFLDLEDEVVKCVMSDEQELSKVVAIVGPGGIDLLPVAYLPTTSDGTVLLPPLPCHAPTAPAAHRGSCPARPAVLPRRLPNHHLRCSFFYLASAPSSTLRQSKKAEPPDSLLPHCSFSLPCVQAVQVELSLPCVQAGASQTTGAHHVPFHACVQVLLTAAVLAKGAPVVEAVQPAVAETKEAAHVPRSYTRHGAGVGYRFHRRAAAAAACIRGSEDYTILKDDLWKLWVAEGFITAVSGQDNHMEEAGKYFDELVNRRMIQPVDVNANNEVLSCTLHSMVLDLIANKSIENNFIVVLDKYQGLVGLPEKIAVHEMKDVGVLEELSALTILCLHVKNAPAEPIGFHKAKFPVLKFFKFICSVPLMEFKEGTMPNLQKLHLGFNAHGAASGGHTPVGMMHLPKLQLLSAVIGCLQAEQSDRNAAESAMRDTISAHGKRPVVNIRWVDWNFYPVYGTMSTRSFHRFPFLSS